MKKWLGIILCLGIILAVFVYWNRGFQQPKIVSLESILPDDAVYYVFSYNLKKKIHDFVSSRFVSAARRSSLYEKFLKAKVERLNKKIPLLNDFVEKDTAVALFEAKEGKPSDDNVPWGGEYLLLTRVDPAKHLKIKKAFADFYLLLTLKNKSTTQKYKGVTITSYPLQEKAVYYSLLSDVVVVSSSRELVHTCIDLFKATIHSGALGNSQNFQKISVKLKKDSLFWGYGNSKRYYQDMLHSYAYNALRSKAAETKGSLESFRNMRPMVNLMNVLEGYGFYLDYNPARSGLAFKAYTLFNRAQDKEAIVKVIAYDKELDNAVFRLIPQAAVGYYGASQDLFEVWAFMKKFYISVEELMKAHLHSSNRYPRSPEQIEAMSVEKTIKAFESFLGLDIERDILSLLGNNFGLVFIGLEDVAVDAGAASFLFPQGYIFCELRDSAKTEKMLEQIAARCIENLNQSISRVRKSASARRLQEAQPPQEAAPAPQEPKEYLALQTDVYNGVKINSIEIADFPVPGIKLNYCILDKYLIFSLSAYVTKRIIKGYTDTEGSLSKNLNFEALGMNAGNGFSNILYFDCRRLIDSLQNKKSYQRFREGLALNRTKEDFSQEDIDSLFTIAGNIHSIVLTQKLSDYETLETSGYFEIKGLQN